MHILPTSYSQSIAADIIGGNNDEVVWGIAPIPGDLSWLALGTEYFRKENMAQDLTYLGKLWSIDGQASENALEESDKERKSKECSEHVDIAV